MATVTRPSDALPDPGDALKAEPIRDHINNILTFLESNNIDSANVDYSSSDGVMVLNQSQTVTGAKNFSSSISLSGSAVVDLNGIADSLVLDEDADTTISAPTDDQIDIEVGGSDLYKFTATAFVSGSNIVSDTTNTDSLGTTALTWSDLYLGDASVLAFGEDQDVTLTHDPDDGIFLNAGMKLAFRDMGGEYIYSVSDGTLGIVAATEVDITTTTLDVNGAVDISGATAIGGTLNVGASTAISNVKDEDNMSSDSATSLSTQQSIKAYVDSQVAGADTLTEPSDTNITSAADASMLLYDTGTSRWIDNVMSGDATLADTGAVTLAGTNTNLTTLANVTTVGTIGTGAWQSSTVVASAYLDAQTAHLNVTQSFTGAKTFGAATQFNSTVTVGVDDAGYDVILYGNAASANATWDASADDLIFNGAAGLIVPEGQLTLGSTAVSSTAAEINLIDGGTARGTDAVATGDGLLVNDGGTMKMTNVDTVSTYFASHNVGGTNIATVGTVGTGTWQGTPVASAYLDTDTAHLGIVQTFTANKTFTGTVTVGVDDTGKDVKFFGASAGAYMEWDESADQLRIVGPSADATTSTGKLLLATSLNDINANDVIGKIEFQAPLEVGADAISVSASIKAIAQSTFTASSNATDIVFSTGHSETATEKFRITSQGELGIGGANYGSDGQVLTSGGAGAAPAWEAAASSGHTIQEEGSGLTARANLNFVGAAVTATDDSGNNATKVTIGSTAASMPLTRSDGSTSDPIALTSAAVGESLVSDTTPQLGGDLDVNGQSIVSDGSNENIPITPHGTGSVVLSKVDVAAGEIDGTAIGANSASTGAFTTLSTSSTSTISGDMTFGDNVKVTLGDGGDVDMYYDATDLIINPRVSGNGNIGLNTTAIADWDSQYFALAVGGSARGVVANTGASAGGSVFLTNNLYHDGSNWAYNIANEEGSYITLSNGTLQFATGTSTSHSAGATATVTTVMTINASNNVGIGETSPAAKFEVGTVASSPTVQITPTHASYASNGLLFEVTRAASTLYSFCAMRSSVAGDTEFSFRGDGQAYADGSWNASGADYQEWFESTDGSELEIGKAVVLDGDKIRIYNAETDSADNILGVTRPQADNKNSAVVGNTAWNHWTDKYLTDDWGVYIRENVTVWTYTEDGDEMAVYERDQAEDWTPPEGAVSSTQSIRKLNPEYSVEVDDETNYSPREDRDEWNLIGLLGQVQIKAGEPTRPTWIKMKDISDAVEMWMIR